MEESKPDVRYVFLDVDGPLNNYDTNMCVHDGSRLPSETSYNVVYEVYNGIIYLICPHMLNHLYDVLRAYDDTKLIGISSWFRGGERNCEGVTRFEKLTGLTIDGVIDYTGGGESRFTCAQKYAEDRGVDKYVIIDDLCFDHPHLVKIERDGLTQEKAQEAIRMIK